MEIYYTLKYIIKNTNIGLLQQIILKCCIYFHGLNTIKYRYKMLYLQRHLLTDTCKPPLKWAIFINGLINLCRQADSWMEINRYNKHLNLELKTLLNIQQNSIFSVNTLFKSCVLYCRYSATVLKSLEDAFKEHTFGSHIIKDTVVDIRFFTNILKDNLILHKKC